MRVHTRVAELPKKNERLILNETWLEVDMLPYNDT